MEKLILAGQGEADWEKGTLSEGETANFMITSEEYWLIYYRKYLTNTHGGDHDQTP